MWNFNSDEWDFWDTLDFEDLQTFLDTLTYFPLHMVQKKIAPDATLSFFFQSWSYFNLKTFLEYPASNVVVLAFAIKILAIFL